MRIRTYITVFYFCLFSATAFSQSLFTEFDVLATEALKSFDSYKIASGNVPEFKEVNGVRVYDYLVGRQLEVTAYIAADSVGELLYSEELVYAMLEALNKTFEKTYLSFTICNVVPIYDFSYANINTADCSNLEFLLKDYYMPNTINLYFLKSIQRDVEGDIKQVSNLVMQPDTLKDNDFILLADSDYHLFAHSFGHFLGLYHCHESALWGTEVVPRTACFTSGDLICDTPAEPFLEDYGLVSADCEYSSMKLNKKDPNYKKMIKDEDGNIYVPSVTNFMSFVPGECAILYSPEQLYRMAKVYYEFYTYLK
ncbi:MAG: hypothetical protein IPO21_08030 [Bacteroidales bacterium]|nr:hypothetical protein [Bacteroidales bacterium]